MPQRQTSIIANATRSEVEKVSDIQSLINRAQSLGQKVDWWNSAMLWALTFAAIAAIAVGIATWMVVTRSKQLGDVQDELTLRLRSQVATLELAAGNTSKDVLVLQKAADDAKAAQQNVETELAKQKERTANAEKAASDAALALAKFKEPRSLSPEQQDTLIKVLNPFAGQNFAFGVFPDPEPLALLSLIDATLKSAGWKRVPSQIGAVEVIAAGESAATIYDSGVAVYIGPQDMESAAAQAALCSALTDAGIRCERHRTPQLEGKTPRAITISIGKKP